MTRVKYVAGIVLVGTIVVSGGGASAQTRPNKDCIGCDVTFSVAVTPEGSHLKAIGSGGVVIEKRVDRKGLRVNVSASGDAVDIMAAPNGMVTIGRRGKVITVRSDSVLSDHEASVKALTAGSAAVEGLEQMVLSLQHSRRPEAMSVLASFALLRALHGDPAGNALLAQRTEQRRAQGLLNVAQHQRGDETTVGDCWAEYEGTLWRNHERYNRCLRDYWWNQPVQYACGLEFAMVAELALFRVIACSGGFPLP